MILFKISKPMNVFRWIVWSAMVAGLLFCVIFLKNLFGIGVMSFAFLAIDGTAVEVYFADCGGDSETGVAQTGKTAG